MRRLLLLALIILVGCGRPQTSELATEDHPPLRAKLRVAPFKKLTEPVGPDIAAAYREWLRDEQTHSTLSALYRRSGYDVAAAIVDGRTPSLPNGGQWLCRADEHREEINSAVERITEARGQWKMSEAIEVGKEASRRFPDSCRIAVELSTAELATTLERTTSPQRQEAAFRILVTGSVEGVVYPSEYVSGAQTLLDLARYLRNANRRDSARAAAELGLAIARNDRMTTSSVVLQRALLVVEDQLHRFLGKL